ncbi:ATPase, T2SS/T4P/T4SS family [Tahibacter amnicola]|uniref:ATPase, T2SS/T4P/T4SS family n=1 Tax=Tahibacter amnicola TaxID=2976241 RepID=A0ABY6BFG5_9GAMM|nr:ATPase, T2SS/T4P/T4SS family [Tahibacter amnicola]UXI68341.1 ATPase, T2SS/T4P/T4SS family [Tahibacter amnicola]
MIDHDDVAPATRLPKLEWVTRYQDPFRFNHADNFKDLILETQAHGVSDVFISPNRPIAVLKSGVLHAITHRILDTGEVGAILKWAVGRDTAVTDILAGRPANGRYEVYDPERIDSRGARVRYGYRVNASPVQAWGGSSAQIVLRAIPFNVPTYDTLGLTEEIVRAATPRDGIVYVAGATGSGKTTTFAAIIRYILENDTPIKGNLITHEEPIEFTYDEVPSAHSIIVQSQIPTHFSDFYSANREAMRRKPGLILIGEMRDEQTIRAAIEASLTGHPVFGTVHAINVAAVMRRLISRFPETERATAIFDIVETARFIMAQKLVRSTSGGLVAAREYLVLDASMRAQLSDLNQMGKVTSAIEDLVETRGHSFRREARRLLEAGLIDEAVARELSHH